ncbi:thioredoxin [uncultured Allofournierella sp.]|uniref:thioredoxin n=1 Tax=uncultured Allofournierella sp. TaxID=1940258 RepID=UPI003752EAF8
MSVMTITSENFQQEVLNSNVPVLVDFWAEWCGPCRMMAPIVDQIAEEKAGSIKVGKIDIDQCPELAAQFGVMSIPTLIVFKNGQVACKNVGLVPKANVEQMLG